MKNISYFQKINGKLLGYISEIAYLYYIKGERVRDLPSLKT
jgi:hypothetical protein